MRKKIKSKQEGLLAALYFISLAQVKESEQLYKSHCILHNNQALSYSGVLTIGHKIEETFEICPNTYKFISALENCEKELSITEMEGKLSIKSGKFTATVPCWHEAMPKLEPDLPICEINNSLREGFELISDFTTDNDKKRIVECSILLKANSMIATDGVIMLEYWHGINLPEIVLPKVFISAIMNTNKNITHFGYSKNTCTFWFEDKSWIKTQLYDEEWPDVTKILNVATNAEELPKGFFEALNKIHSFSEGKETEKKVFFGKDKLQSHRNEIEGASCEVFGIKPGAGFNIKRLKRVEKCIKTVDFYTHSAMYFFNNDKKVRGCLMGVSK